ncbi:MAG: heparinase II/III domain-containing protein [Acidobacteriota bacterium]
MKRRDFLKTTAVLSGAQLVGAHLTEQKTGGSRPGGNTGKTANNWVQQHPRLYFDPKRVARLRQQVKDDDGVKRRWAKLLERADALVQAELVTEAMARQPARQGNAARANYPQASGQISAMGMTLGLAYHVTGQERYAQKLRQALLHYAGYQQWCSPAYNTRKPSWNSELATGAFCFGAAVGYDALHDFLSVEDRKRIAQAMARLGILPTLNDWVLPERRIHALDSMGHNWWSVCVSLAGVAALSLLGDDERAPEWVERAAHGLEEWFGYRGNVLQNKPANFDDAGAFYESVHYTDYAVSEYLLFRLALSNAMPKYLQPRIPALERVGDFFTHTLYPATGPFFTVNFGDSYLQEQQMRSMRLLPAVGLDSAAVRFYLKQTGGNSSDAMALLDPSDIGVTFSPALPTSVIYPDIGWAMLRSSWEDNATLLAVKSGFFWNHAHADAGSFILFHAGQPLIIDSGTCSYGRKEYGGYYMQSRAHNVILFNGQGQPEEDRMRGSKFSGQVHSLMDGLGVKYVYADATGPMARYLNRNYRHWLWLEGAILIFDDVLAHEAGRFDWLLHYAGSAHQQGNEVTLTNGPAKAAVRFLFPEQLTVREEQGLAERNPDQKRMYLSFSPAAPSREQKFITAIMPHTEGRSEALPKLELLRSENALGVRIHGLGHVTEAWLNLQADGRRMHENSHNVIAGWETDAYLVVLTRPASATSATPQTVTRYLVTGASYLRNGGQVVVDSLSKVDALFQAGEELDVHLHGQDSMGVALYAAAKPARLKVNGKPTPFEHAHDEHLARFQVRENRKANK